MALVHFAAWILLGLALVLSGGVRAQTVEVLQSPETIAVKAGESAKFNCIITVTGGLVYDPVRWFKGSGDTRTLIYSEGKNFPRRVARVSSRSGTDFSIKIHNISTEDTGTYYCVKFKKTLDGDKELTSGGGTSLFVRDLGTQIVAVLQSPETIAVTAEGSATFSCNVSVVLSGFGIGQVQWYKGSGKGLMFIYADDARYPRVSRVSPGSGTDWSIRITNTSTEDTGTYYCTSSQDEEHTSGTGTILAVSVEAPGSPGVCISSQVLWIGFVVEKLCLMAVILGVIYLKQRNSG